MKILINSSNSIKKNKNLFMNEEEHFFIIIRDVIKQIFASTIT